MVLSSLGAPGVPFGPSTFFSYNHRDSYFAGLGKGDTDDEHADDTDADDTDADDTDADGKRDAGSWFNDMF